MSKKDNTLCSWKKSEYTADKLLPVVMDPKVYCEKCGRIARKKKYLCEPKPLSLGVHS